MKEIGYFVSIISVSNIDAKNFDKKIFVNNMPNLLFLSLIHFNLFLLKTRKIVQRFVKTLFQFV